MPEIRRRRTWKQERKDMADKRQLIKELVIQTENLPEYDENLLEELQKELDNLLERAEIVFRHCFGTNSPYYERIEKGIVFTPISFYTADNPSGSLGLEKYAWDNGKKELTELLKRALRELEIIGE